MAGRRWRHLRLTPTLEAGGRLWYSMLTPTHLFSGTGEQRPNFEWNMGTNTIIGNREHKKTNFRFLGNWGTGQFISAEQGKSHLGGASLVFTTLFILIRFI